MSDENSLQKVEEISGSNTNLQKPTVLDIKFNFKNLIKKIMNRYNVTDNRKQTLKSSHHKLSLRPNNNNNSQKIHLKMRLHKRLDS